MAKRFLLQTRNLRNQTNLSKKLNSAPPYISTPPSILNELNKKQNSSILKGLTKKQDSSLWKPSPSAEDTFYLTKKPESLKTPSADDTLSAAFQDLTKNPDSLQTPSSGDTITAALQDLTKNPHSLQTPSSDDTITAALQDLTKSPDSLQTNSSDHTITAALHDLTKNPDSLLPSSDDTFKAALQGLIKNPDSPISSPIFEDPSLVDTTFTTTTTTTSTTSPKDLNLEDVKELFASVPTRRLLRSSLTLQMASFEPMIDIGMWVMNSRLMGVPITKKLILETVKHTFYEHFCAGSNLEEVARTINKLRDAGIRGMLDYGLEHANDTESCDQNLKDFIQIIESTKFLPPDSVSFAVVKITAICPPSLLKRVSDQLRWEYKDKSFHLPWKRKSLPIFTELSPLYHTPNKPQPLTIQEERDLEQANERLQKICEKCIESGVPLLVDAEDTNVQPAIDYLTYSAALTYYKDDDPVVYGTIQTYLKDSKERLIQTSNAAEKMGVPMGFKLVRGAYMSSEGKLAASLGVKSPIHECIGDTHQCYDDCASFMLKQIANGSGAVVLATHNIESGKLAAGKAIELGIKKENHKLQFAQLYGMAEVLSFALRNAGFQVSKYLPFGHVDLIMPYLLRRAEENRGLLSTASIDRELMRKELRRRSRSGK